MKKDEIKAAYRELWEATENGTVDRDFFKLREKAHRVLNPKIITPAPGEHWNVGTKP